MGLDMYLYKKTYVQQWDHQKPESKFAVTVKKGGKAFKGIDGKKISYVIEQVGYWRKANQIHAWFVTNVQKDQDDCGEYDVSTEQLQELLDLCKQVLADKSKAEELLPAQSGFFFGSTKYDEYYFSDLEETVNILTEAIEQEGKGRFYYSSSW